MPLNELVILGIFCTAAATTQSISGFGFGVVLVGVLPIFGIDIKRVVVLVTVLVTVNVGIALWRLRRHASWRRVLWVWVGVPLGFPAGLYLLTSAPLWMLRGLLGGVLVFAAIEPVFMRRRKPAPEKRRWALLTGVASGLLGGALSTGGPPVVIYFYRRQWSKELTKASVVLTFVGTLTVRLVGYTLKGGLITQQRLLESAILLPMVILGSLIGERLFHSISQRGFRRVVAAMLVVCGVYQLGKAAGAW